LKYLACNRITKGLSSSLFVISISAGAYSFGGALPQVLADGGGEISDSARASEQAASGTDASGKGAAPGSATDQPGGAGGPGGTQVETRPLRAVASATASEQQSAMLNKPAAGEPVEDVDEASFQDFHATAYCLKGRTATGAEAQTGIIAADPTVLPLGTVVHIKSGTYTGTYKVQDTGYHIKGNRVDIYVANHAEAIRFGRRQVKLRVLNRVRRVHKR
jgi:3D (Asp-Asp-Asp) domain-containing protein